VAATNAPSCATESSIAGLMLSARVHACARGGRGEEVRTEVYKVVNYTARIVHQQRGQGGGWLSRGAAAKGARPGEYARYPFPKCSMLTWANMPCLPSAQSPNKIVQFFFFFVGCVCGGEPRVFLPSGPAMGAVVSAVYGLGGAGVVACMVW
jgi:hypothetical protein